MRNIWRLLRLVPNFNRRIAKVAVINGLLGATAAALPYLLKLLLDRVILAIDDRSEAALEQIAVFLGIIVAVRIAVAILEYFQEKVSDTFFLDTLADLRERVFNHLLQLAIDFYESSRVGEVIQKVNSGVLDLARWISRVFEGMLEVLISLLFMLVLLWILVPPIGLVMTIVFPLNLYLARHVARKVQPARKEWLKYNEQTNGELTETLTHISTVRSFDSERYKSGRYHDLNNFFRDFRLKQFRMVWSSNFLRNFINASATAIALFIATYGAINGSNSVGDIFLVALYIQRLISNIIPLSRLISDTADVEGTCERLNGILENEHIIRDRTDAVQLDSLESIEFKQVGFSYPGKKKTVLENVSFKINSGETVALVGPSGVGKSTITKLILRFYEPTSGEILINGQPIDSYTQSSLRNLTGLVMQDVALFNETIEENIRFANPSVNVERLKKAAKVAHADSFINKLPEKYQTMVGERGIKLSGGEKQRVAIARAVLRDPQLVILDEATSALDSQSERYVQDGLKKLLKNRTALIIAHRLSTVMRADKIIVLKNGAVLEQGRHKELLKTDGLYAKLFSMQSDSLKELELTQ